MSIRQEFHDVLRRNRDREPVGVVSVCSAHPMVLDATLRRTAELGGFALIEATCNQVNQEGGYSGLTPAAFRDRVWRIADHVGLARESVLLGGDHLGPNPWRDEPAANALDKACTMVAAYAEAGFVKLHLDPSMACAGESAPLDPELIAERAATLCGVAEAAARNAGLAAPLYVIGAEVPVPGGGTDDLGIPELTPAEDVRKTLDVHRAAFRALRLQDAVDRVVGLVVQPGVEFGATEIAAYRPEMGRKLSEAVEAIDDIVFEAHSTDYQTQAALEALVAGHFAILKVGPELTFAMREAIFALDSIDAEMSPADRRAGVRNTVERAMLDNPRWWQGYFGRDPTAQRLGRLYSFSDRVRYYWTDPAVAAAVDTLMRNLRSKPLIPTLVSQFMPTQYAALREGHLSVDPGDLIRHRIDEVLDRYAQASGTHMHGLRQVVALD